MILIEICLVVCVATLFGILNRLCQICSVLEDIKNLITNPKIILPDEVVEHIAELLKVFRAESKTDRGLRKNKPGGRNTRKNPV